MVNLWCVGELDGGSIPSFAIVIDGTMGLARSLAVGLSPAEERDQGEARIIWFESIVSGQGANVCLSFLVVVASVPLEPPSSGSSKAHVSSWAIE